MGRISQVSNSNPLTPKKRNGSKKKRKLSRKQSYRLRKKMNLSKIKCETADRSYLHTICVTRTVELPSTQKIGEEKSKLLFMLAIGLNPKPETSQNLPCILIRHLDQSTLTKAKAKTKERIFEMCRKLELAALSQRTSQVLIGAPTRPRVLNGDVELVDLVSDDEGDNEFATRISGPRLDTDHEDLSIIPKVLRRSARSVKPLLSMASNQPLDSLPLTVRNQALDGVRPRGRLKGGVYKT